ncbi:hypothetical protein COV61_01005 [Candidatus Micrarchaeota archaeon CG11_big_fil_rev_8_21_14_0_20_47_5]|nr:MAG: hypothetical protein AUJ17_02105 [Candidatus Micrarchaeota archaeon CG1_02_47_40]PIN84150.1 MAG: hypothetical protein COV61_01005 [Candidatus Micrarchaeota archaeon CG11_big_fil_rev_8_21_14_0_20_47_5]
MLNRVEVKYLLTFLLAILSIFLVAKFLEADFHALLKFLLCVGILYASGILLRKIWRLEGTGAIIMLKSRRGLSRIDQIANAHPKLWQAFADFGMVFGFGLSSIFIFDDFKTRLRYYAPLIAISIILLILSSIIMTPFIFPLASSLISGIDLTQSAKTKLITSQAGLILPLSFLLIILGGVLAFALFGLLFYSATILSAIAGFFMGDASAISTTQPGASFLLPGVNLPLFEGIIALFLLLLVHEVAHGLLARLAKIKLDSSGIVLFGILPVGAFVDPDEKEFLAAPPLAQKRLLVAGSSANFIASAVAFFLLLLFLFSTYDARVSAIQIVSGNGTLANGTLIYAINGIAVNDSFAFPSFSAGEKAVFATNKGEIKATAGEKGTFGILYLPIYKSGIGGKAAYKSGFEFLGFFHTTIALLFILNFIVGVVNLLPLPFFDGQRIFELTIKHKLVSDAITALVAIAFVVNFLPWLFR